MYSTSCKIVPLANSNRCLHFETSETEVNINISANNDSEELSKKLRLPVS